MACYRVTFTFNPLNAELNSICHLLELIGAQHILRVSRVRVNLQVLLPCNCFLRSVLYFTYNYKDTNTTSLMK